DAVEAVRPEGTTGASLAPVGTEHKVVNDELAASREKVGEAHLSLRPVEDVVLLDFFPRERAALPGEIVPELREFLLFGEKRPPRCHPLVVRDDGMVIDARHDLFLFHISLLTPQSFNQQGEYMRPASCVSTSHDVARRRRCYPAHLL